jgi:hypothetical protein
VLISVVAAWHSSEDFGVLNGNRDLKICKHSFHFSLKFDILLGRKTYRPNTLSSLLMVTSELL